ncbi:MAG: hypothetical protein JWO78_595 [Micavibrio sp.]|nr:hypothetical protein [Micavibrio sp.]
MAAEKVVSLTPSNRTPGRIRPVFSLGLPRTITAAAARVSFTRGTVTCLQSRAWNVSVPVNPDLAVHILTRDLPDVEEVELEYSPYANEVSCSLRGDGYYDRRDFGLGSGRTGHGTVSVDVRKQGAGIGRILMRNEIEFAHALNMRTFSIYAGGSAGGYTWASLGFEPDKIDSEDFNTYTRNLISRHYEAVKDCLTEEERYNVRPLLDLIRTKDLRQLARQDADFSVRLKTVFAQAVNHDSEQNLVRDSLRERFNVRLRLGKKITLGQVLLAGTTWRGHIDLQDPVQMRRAGEYAGGWKYIGLR